MKTIAFIISGLLYFMPANSQPTGELKLQTAGGHPMQYYISLPEGWTPQKKWPVVVVAEAAEKAFNENAQRFINARHDRPFIIVAPVIVSNGNYGRRDTAVYPYTAATWDKIDKSGVCDFDIEGLARVMDDVKKLYHGDDHFFITGFEAGTHLVWAVIFRHPEWLWAAAPVAGNYIGRCMEDGLFSTDSSRFNLPVKGFVGTLDSLSGPGKRLYGQWQQAYHLAIQNGYKNVSETTLPGKQHVPVPEEVLSYFYEVWKQRN